MYGVGAVEIAAGLMVLLLPRLAPYVVAGWLGGIVTNLVIFSAAEGGHTHVYWDIALRDFGLLVGALALARLAAVYAPNPFRRRV
jgi:general stress protein CsbA